MKGMPRAAAPARLVCGVLAIAGTAHTAIADSQGNCHARQAYLVISGTTFDRERMAAYGRALAETGLYEQLGAYYLNAPRPVEVLEGDPPDNYVTLVVRFPSLEAVRTFWHSDEYQNRVKPLRLDPPAADYTVSVYHAVDLPAYLREPSGAATGGDSSSTCASLPEPAS